MTYCDDISVWALQEQRLCTTYRNEKVWNGFLVTCPRFAVLSAASGDVSGSAVNDHNHEEDEVEPGKRAPISRNISDRKKLQSFAQTTHLNPVINPQAIEKNISGT